MLYYEQESFHLVVSTEQYSSSSGQSLILKWQHNRTVGDHFEARSRVQVWVLFLSTAAHLVLQAWASRGASHNELYRYTVLAFMWFSLLFAFSLSPKQTNLCAAEQYTEKETLLLYCRIFALDYICSWFSWTLFERNHFQSLSHISHTKIY